jgi:hypothetical protein
MQAKKVKLMAALVGGSAVVAMGAVTVASHEQSKGTINVVGAGGMTIGATSTQQSVPPSTPSVSVAVPPVKAKPK